MLSESQKSSLYNFENNSGIFQKPYHYFKKNIAELAVISERENSVESLNEQEIVKLDIRANYSIVESDYEDLLSDD